MKKVLIVVFVCIVSSVFSKNVTDTIYVNHFNNTCLFFDSEVIKVNVGSESEIGFTSFKDVVLLHSRVDKSGFLYESDCYVETKNGIYVFVVRYGNIEYTNQAEYLLANAVFVKDKGALVERGIKSVKIDTIKVNLDKTSYLNFGSDVETVFIGNKDFARFEKDGNRVHLLGRTEFFNPCTNVLVETALASYVFVLEYSANNSTVFKNISIEECFRVRNKEIKALVESSESLVEAKEKLDVSDDVYKDSLIVNAKMVFGKKDNVFDYGFNSKKMKFIFYLSGVYIKDDLLYLKVKLHNKSNINYYIDLMSISSENNVGKLKKSIESSNFFEPITFVGGDGVVEPGEKQEMVFVYNKFTIVNKKHLFVELWETNDGDRMLNFEVPGDVLLSCEPF